MRNIVGLMIVAVFLTACSLPATPIVADYNGDSVTIVTPAFANATEARQKAQAEADRICVKGHKKRAEYASTRSNQQTYEQHHLFLCLT